MSEKLSAAQAAIEHLRSFGPNARVLILAPTVNVLAQICVHGADSGLLRLYEDEFSVTGNPIHTGQFNHKGGGQVRLMTPLQSRGGAIRGHIYTFIWAENMQDSGEKALYALEEAREHLRSGRIVYSFEGFYEGVAQ